MNPIDFRRHLHRHPELSFEEHLTAAFIREALTAEGIAWQPIATTGTLAILRGRNTDAKSERRAVILRADIDALPIEEQTALPYASENRGVMHACGHDMHAATLYGALCELNRDPDFAGVVFGLFQPGEECNPGGASLVLKEKPFAGYDILACIGEHVEWQLEVGTIGLKAGQYMASSDELRFTVEGVGGHGAMRHLVKDPIASAATLITRLLALNAPEQVLSIGNLHGAGATNVIPDKVYMEGTLRTFSEENRQTLHQTIRDLAQENDTLHGTTTHFELSHGYPSVVNDSALVALAEKEATRLGLQVTPLGLRFTAEDFGFYTQCYPSLFFRLGVGASAGRSHTPHFSPDERALEHGITLFKQLTLNILQR